MNIPARILRTVFHLLYHPFAWSYDSVAAVVSFGRWKRWVEAVIPFTEGPRILELGHGPGHLQRFLRDRGLLTVGLDESRPMGVLASRNLKLRGYTQAMLVQGIAQCLPFPPGSFNSVVATFPSEYFLDARTLGEVSRVLGEGGRFIVLPLAWITGKKTIDRFLAWLFRITGQTPSDPFDIIRHKLVEPFESAGYQVRVHRVEMVASLLMIVVAEKIA